MHDKAQASTSEKIEASTSDVETYVRGYLQLEVQAADQAPTDPQLATLVPWLVDRLSSGAAGTIIDIGCGEGALFARLAELPQFLERKQWLYVGVGDDPSLLKVHALARALRISRRAELVDLDSFYLSWPSFGSPQLIFVRNVLHEIDVGQTARLLAHVSGNFGPHDEMVIQDLIKLRVGERHSACWIPSELKRCIEAHGYQSVRLTEQASKSGNAWFALVAGQRVGRPPSGTTSKVLVQSARQRQWAIWSQVEEQFSRKLPDRSKLVEALDIDLQLAALTRQLRDSGGLELTLQQDVEKRVRAAEFTKRVSRAIEASALRTSPVEERIHFRERGEQLTLLETFLRSSERLAVVRGGPGTGKTSLVRRILSTRAYDKFVAIIDCRRSKDIWSVVENLFSQFGLNLDAEALSVLTNLGFASIQPTLRQFFNAYSDRTIFFVDNFNEIVNTNNEIGDRELSDFLDLMVNKDGAKVILASRSEDVPAPLRRSSGSLPVAVKVGRYGTDLTVINILDDKFSRSAAGIDSYPDELLAAIDRHPLIASLAAKILHKGGRDLLVDQKFISELRHQLHDDLWNRLVDDASRPAIEATSQLRIAVPRDMLRQLVAEDSILSALNAELIYASRDYRWTELLSALALFRVRDLSDTLGQPPDIGNRRPVDHAKVADLYRAVYRADDDPKWIRESYFHLLLAGNSRSIELSTTLGKYYYTELVASADYAYVRRRDYALALELYRIASSILPLQEGPEMRRASCLIRGRLRSEGEDAYRALIRQFPTSRGIKTSHVDALLYLSDFEAALAALRVYDLKPDDGEWVAYQWGRVYLGLHQYREAIRSFRSLAAQPKPDSHHFVHLGRALEHFGDAIGAIAAFQKGRTRFPDDVGITTELAMSFERQGNEDEALGLLNVLFAARNDNVQAAASMIRIYVDRGELSEARRIFNIAERAAPPNLPWYLTTARADLLFGGGLRVQAIDLLFEQDTHDAFYIHAILKMICRALKNAASEEEKRQFVARGLALKVSPSLAQNAPIHLFRAELALFGKDRQIFAEELDLLKCTGTHESTIKDLEKRAVNALNGS